MIVWLVTPGAKCSDPDWPVKSAPLVAVPLAVAKFTFTANPAAVLSVTVKVAVPAASFTVTSLIESVGAPSLSAIVAVPIALAFVVVPAVRRHRQGEIFARFGDQRR